MKLGSLPVYTMGFDCNQRVRAREAVAFYKHNYRFVMRYVRRGAAHTYDLSKNEIVELHDSGLGVGIVQHVDNPGWETTGAKGHAYGIIAAEEAQILGTPAGLSVWCDLEGVGDFDPQSTIDYCNGWFDAVKQAGYKPGLYVGDNPNLDSHQLYYRLKFQAYWAAYNLDLDQYPVIRGVQMRQRKYPRPELRVPGITFEYDENTVLVDSKGGTPTFLLP